MRPVEAELEHISGLGQLRCVREIPGGIMDFGSNDYLGLSRHPALLNAASQAVRDHGTGSTGSRLITGTTPLHQRLEERLAELKGTEAALTFATGYATAVGTLTALAKPGDTLILDKLCHASLIDGARQSGATVRVFPHNNLTKLKRLLQSHAPTNETRTIVVTESVFSMDGDIAPLEEIVRLKNEHGAWLLVDEAHALGLLGPQGLGLAEDLKLQNEIDLQMGTFSKAAGSAGGYLAAERSVIDLILNTARPFIYSTAPPPAQIAASLAALDLITSDEGTHLRARLRRNVQSFNGINARTSIQPVVIGDNCQTLARRDRLQDLGYFVPAIRFPTVPRGQARLRISLRANHETSDVLALRDALQNLAEEVN